MPGLGLTFLRHALRPAAVTSMAVAGLGSLLLAAQVLARAPVVPGPSGAARVALGMLPVALHTALPAAALVGLVAAARSWALGGEWRGLAASGHGTRRLAGTLLFAGVVGGVAQAWLSHQLAPAGRRVAREALVAAASDLGLRAGEPLVLPGGVLRARVVQGRDWGGVFFAQEDVVVAARRGRVRDGVLVLEQGSARDLRTGWAAAFERARVPLHLPGRRFELAERGMRSYRELLARKRAAGERAAYETLIFYKRSTSALAVPLLALLAVPLGARRGRPALVALGVLLAWWACIRIFDQAVHGVGPALAATAPLLMLGLATAVAWWRWRAR